VENQQYQKRLVFYIFLKTILGETQVLSGTINYGQEQGIELFSVVSQHPFIFDETLIFNLTFDSPIDESRVIEILRRVGMKHLATKEMLHTKMDKQLHSLSGGELKRFSLRRYDEPRDWNLSFAVSLIDKEYYLIVFMPWVKNKIISFSMDHERLYFELESGEKIQFKLILPEFVKNTVLNLFKLINPLSLV